MLHVQFLVPYVQCTISNALQLTPTKKKKKNERKEEKKKRKLLGKMHNTIELLSRQLVLQWYCGGDKTLEIAHAHCNGTLGAS